MFYSHNGFPAQIYFCECIWLRMRKLSDSEDFTLRNVCLWPWLSQQGSFMLLKKSFRIFDIWPGLTSPSPRTGEPVDALEHSRVKQASLQLKILYHTPRGVHFTLLVPAAAVRLFPNLRSHWWVRRSAIGCLRNFIIFSKGRIYSRGFLRWSFMLRHFELWVFKLLRDSGSWWP